MKKSKKQAAIRKWSVIAEEMQLLRDVSGEELTHSLNMRKLASQHDQKAEKISASMDNMETRGILGNVDQAFQELKDEAEKLTSLSDQFERENILSRSYEAEAKYHIRRLIERWSNFSLEEFLSLPGANPAMYNQFEAIINLLAKFIN